MGRFGQPDEIASVVELLVGNAYMTNKVSFCIVGRPCIFADLCMGGADYCGRRRMDTICLLGGRFLALFHPRFDCVVRSDFIRLCKEQYMRREEAGNRTRTREFHLLNSSQYIINQF